MFSVQIFIRLLCVLMLLAGCGQKGDLYLPEQAPASQTEEAADDARDDNEADS